MSEHEKLIRFYQNLIIDIVKDNFNFDQLLVLLDIVGALTLNY